LGLIAKRYDKIDVKSLADWKTQKGVPTVVVTIDEIKAKYRGRDLQEQIRNYLSRLRVFVLSARGVVCASHILATYCIIFF